MATYTFYIDLYAGIDPNTTAGMLATTRPSQKMDSSKRISFDVTIPDEIMFGVDGKAAHVTKPKILAE